MGDFKQIVVNEEITSQEYWREQHIKLLLLLSVFAVAMEIFAFFLMNILSLNQTSNKMYFIKYILFPALSYFVIDAFVVGIYRNRKISKAFKNYAISIGMVAFITILYLAHDSFPIIFASGIIVILLTSVYSNPKLTAIVAVLASLSAVLVGTFSTFNNVKVVDSTYLLSVFIAVLLHLAAYICCYCIILNSNSKQFCG